MTMVSSLKDHHLFIIADRRGLTGTVTFVETTRTVLHHKEITRTVLHRKEITRTVHHNKGTSKHTARSKMAMLHSRIMRRLDKVVEVMGGMIMQTVQVTMDCLVDTKVHHLSTKDM